jgi:hypothetical protein
MIPKERPLAGPSKYAQVTRPGPIRLLRFANPHAQRVRKVEC